MDGRKGACACDAIDGHWCGCSFSAPFISLVRAWAIVIIDGPVTRMVLLLAFLVTVAAGRFMVRWFVLARHVRYPPLCRDTDLRSQTVDLVMGSSSANFEKNSRRPCYYRIGRDADRLHQRRLLMVVLTGV